MKLEKLLAPSPTVNFADVAHSTLIFEREKKDSSLVLELIDTKWVQRLRRIRQTGNTHLVYMFAEHSRFGHSLGVAHLAVLLMNKLEQYEPEMVDKYREAVAAAALLHDIGHVAPGSHLAAHVWSPESDDQHEQISTKIIKEDEEINAILKKRGEDLPDLVVKILLEDPSLPSWTHAIISGGGWNADRGNWTIVDSTMCSVSYGRYNVSALIDAFRLTPDGQLILQENRLDALAHFFVARDSMYRQVYRHRVLQTADALNEKIVLRLRDILKEKGQDEFSKLNIKLDEVMLNVVKSDNYAEELSLNEIFQMSEDWWNYHLNHWCSSSDRILKDLATRLRDRKLLKTIRLVSPTKRDTEAFISNIESVSKDLEFPPRYYVIPIGISDNHRKNEEKAPLVLRDDGSLAEVSTIEPIIASLYEEAKRKRQWLAVPKEVKAKLGTYR